MSNEPVNHPPMSREEFLKCVDEVEGGCWVWNKSRDLRGGYGQKRIGKTIYKAHRLAWIVFNQEHPASNFVCHRCDNPPCCNPDHLFLSDARGNINDAWSKGRLPLPKNAPKGESHHSAKLTDLQVQQIKDRIREGESLKSIGQFYGVTRQRIWKIKKEESWKTIR